MGLLNGAALAAAMAAAQRNSVVRWAQQSTFASAPRGAPRETKRYPYDGQRQRQRYGRQQKAHNNYGAGNGST